MIITCPSCSTRFQIGDAALGPAGRRVRCAKCGESWWQDPPPEVAAEPSPGADAFAPPSIPDEPVTPPERDQPVDWPEIRSDPPFWQLSDRGVVVGWAALGILISAIAIGGWFGRHAVVAHWPGSERMYSALGFPALGPVRAFDMRETRASWEEEGKVLLVEGRLANLTEDDRPFPEIRIVLRDAEGNDLAAIPLRPDGASPRPESLEAGGDVVVMGELVGVPDTAVEVSVFIAPAIAGPGHSD